MAGLFGIFTHEDAPSTSIAAGSEGIGAAFLDAWFRLQETRRSRCSVVLYDDQMPDVFSVGDDAPPVPIAAASAVVERRTERALSPRTARPRAAKHEPHWQQIRRLAEFLHGKLPHVAFAFRARSVDVDRTLKTDFYYWRLFATGFCFVAFGVGGLVLGILVTPLLHVAIRDRVRRQRLVRKLVHRSFGLFIGVMRFVGVMTYEFHGLQRLREPGQFVIANHPTLIDIVFLVARIPDGICVVKGRAVAQLLARRAVAAGGIRGKRDGPADIARDMCRRVAQRSNADHVPRRQSFGSGNDIDDCEAARPMSHWRRRRNLTPVHISCTPPTLTKANRWHDIPIRRMHFVIDVGDRIPVAPPDSSTSQRISARAITERVTRHLLQETPAYE